MCHRLKCGLQKVADYEQPDVMITTTYSMKVLGIILGIKTSAHRLIESHIACYTVRKAYDYRKNAILFRLARLYDQYVFGKIRRFERLIVLTAGDAKDWQEYITNVEIIPNPVTTFPDEVLPHDGSGHRIIAVGRLHEQKGYDLLIEAFSLIASNCPEWHIDIFGSGDDEVMLRQMIADRNLGGRIMFHVPTNDIYMEYQTSDFLVLSSRYEGFALVLLESASCGIPTVAFRCKYGPEDFIVNGENGLLVTDGDINELAEKMLWMIEHTDERLRMGTKAREEARNYQIDLIMKRWEILFQTFQKN
jgi:glycosyltransferase involved in cell wall biosynthesis